MHLEAGGDFCGKVAFGPSIYCRPVCCVTPGVLLHAC